MTVPLQFISTSCNTAVTAIADHLWQSTLFGVAAALLTLAFRKNSAGLRYSLWLTASVKFLVPFSLLVAIGSHFSWRHTPVAPATGMYMAEIVAQPFANQLPMTQPGMPI